MANGVSAFRKAASLGCKFSVGVHEKKKVFLLLPQERTCPMILAHRKQHKWVLKGWKNHMWLCVFFCFLPSIFTNS